MHISNKCSIAVHCLVFIHEYGEIHKVTSELLSMSSGCNPVIIRNIMSALKKDGIISVRFGTGGATLVCPPEEITLYRICMCVEPDALDKLIGIHQNPSPLCPVGNTIQIILEHSYSKVRSDLEKSMSGITLSEIIKHFNNVSHLKR